MIALRIRYEALALLNDGYTTREVAERLGLNFNTVESWKSKHRAGLRIHGPGRDASPQQWRQCDVLYFETQPPVSQRQAARLCGLSRQVARGMWAALRQYRRAKLIHPKVAAAIKAAAVRTQQTNV